MTRWDRPGGPSPTCPCPACRMSWDPLREGWDEPDPAAPDLRRWLLAAVPALVLIAAVWWRWMR